MRLRTFTSLLVAGFFLSLQGYAQAGNSPSPSSIKPDGNAPPPGSSLTIAGPTGSLTAGQPIGFGCNTSGTFSNGSSVTFSVLAAGSGSSETGPASGNGTSNVSYTFSSISAGTYQAHCNYGSVASNYINFTISAQGEQGFVNPKYVVVGLTYAPPGPNSSVSYANTVSVGNTTTISSSVTNGTQFSVSIMHGGGTPGSLPAAQVAGSGGVSLTYTSSTGYTQSSNATNTTTLSKSTSLTYKTSGYSIPIAAGTVASDYDYVWLWLNPVKVFTYYPAAGSTPASLVDQGYAYDPTDPAGSGGPDVYPVQIGYLNGHFADNPSIDSVLARSWTSSESLQWPAGEGPGLTATDKAHIVALDPFTNSSYTQLSNLPQQSGDGRFTQGPFPPNPLAFVPGESTTYSAAQMTTQTASQQNTSTFTQAFGVSTKFSLNIFDVYATTTTFSQQQTFTWTHMSLNSLTTTNTLTNSLTIVGPPSSYNGPTQYIYYQDNLFGTFAFPPS